MSAFATADLCDLHAEVVQVSAPIWRDFGGQVRFHGPVATLRCFEDNSLVRAALSETGAGRVLVVDAGGSLRCAMLGDNLARMAVDNGWAGVLLWGCVRDTEVLCGLPLGIKALASHPRRSEKRGTGEREVELRFAELRVRPGQHLYADADGVLLAEGPLALSN
jgi:regulator of ribonuclease activity A